MSKFHEDWEKNVSSRLFTCCHYIHIKKLPHSLAAMKNSPPIGSHFFQAKVTIFELIQDIIGTNHLSKFHEDRKINVASRVKCPAPWRPYIIGMNLLTKFHEDLTINVASREKCPAPWQPCFLSKHIIETNLLTKFHEDWTINVGSRELTSQMLTPHNARKTKGDHKSSR
ncbi:hypothetical protein DPMN_171228 [Dreissena polymorpha]|uniref:Uncharacterized protein n=1 Tax=Dreissena polymorpha TaxID=45954 RepID=A0A9D4E0U3_DREPO|nr:hypothetical protein DPMN_171228 [Dreissena polymorpha]